MPVSILNAARTLRDHVVTHPDSVLTAASHALRRRVPIHMGAIRWLLDELLAGRADIDSLELSTRPPGLRVEATADVMGNPLQMAATIEVDGVHLAGDEVRLVVRLSEVEAVAMNPDTPLGQVLSSGAIDLSKPANLLNFVPKRPDLVVSATDDVFELDLLRIPGLGDNPWIRKVLAAAAPLLDVTEVRADADWLLITWEPVPSGVLDALSAVRR
ncbi:MAG: hypothetical protein ACQEXJ_24055 [Myxococcota bacterium]